MMSLSRRRTIAVPVSTLSKLTPGFYNNLTRYPFHNSVKGGLSWSGEGRGCNTLTGWFVIDNIVFQGDKLTELDLRFEQNCDGGSAALRGKIHWTSNDNTAAPGPAAIPAGLWQPAAGATPATGNYVHLSSTGGDYIGGGRTYDYTSSNAVLVVTGNGARTSVSVRGDEDWSGNFAGMNSLSKITTGYYADLSRYPFHKWLECKIYY